jgi:formate dehydrogenase maturation protein FdhE
VSLLRDAAEGQACVCCGRQDQTVVGAHYTGKRRLSYGGGFGKKVNDLVMAHLCGECHKYMDQLSREKDKGWEHSEEFLHYVMLTILSIHRQGILVVKGERR